MDLFDLIEKLVANAGSALAVLGSAAGLLGVLVSWSRDRMMRRKEYTDRIRHSAATTVAKIERWHQIFLGFFQDVQKEITQADIGITKGVSAIDVRDTFWLGVVEAYGRAHQRLLAEEIEIAYAHLYGYDPRIHALFNEAIKRLQLINNLCYITYLNKSQSVIINARGVESELRSADMGNALRDVVVDRRVLASECMESVIGPFRAEVLKLIEASDGDIYARRIDLKTPQNVFRPEQELQARFVSEFAFSFSSNLDSNLCMPDGLWASQRFPRNAPLSATEADAPVAGSVPKR